ncbi:hypothetical protein KUCAC02_028366, partial [Chaenocephalus aceratus]
TKRGNRDRASDRLYREAEGDSLRDLSRQLVHSSLKHFCTKRLTAEAAAFSSLKAGLFFDLARNKVFTFPECTTMDG